MSGVLRNLPNRHRFRCGFYRSRKYFRVELAKDRPVGKMQKEPFQPGNWKNQWSYIQTGLIMLNVTACMNTSEALRTSEKFPASVSPQPATMKKPWNGLIVLLSQLKSDNKYYHNVNSQNQRCSRRCWKAENQSAELQTKAKLCCTPVDHGQR